MSAGIINDFLQESLTHLEAESAAVLNELAELHIHDSTAPILIPQNITAAETEPRAPSPALDNPAVEQAVRKLETVQESFSEISALVLQLRNGGGSQKTTAKVNNKFLDLRKITKVLEPFAEGSVVKRAKDELNRAGVSGLSEKEIEIVSKLEEIVSQYALVALYQISLTQMLRSTLPLGDDLLYWELTSSSSWRTLLYSMQTLPLRVKALVDTVWLDLKNAARPNVNSLEIAVPEYITRQYPSYQDTYKLFVHYKRLLVNSLYNKIIANNLKGFYKLIGSKKNYHNALFGKRISQPSTKSYMSVMLGTPFNSVVQELSSKRDDAKLVQDENAKKLGALLLSVPNFKNVKYDARKIQKSLEHLQRTLDKSISPSGDLFKALYETSSSLLPTIKSQLHSQTSRSMKPSFLTRYWPTLLTVLLYGPSAVVSVITNRELILQFIQKNLVETVIGFWKNWIIKPANNILSTIRHDDNSSISIMSQKSLDSDLESLKRMVVEYTVDTAPEYKGLKSTDIELLKQELDKMVSTGDMTTMMKGYEQDIKQPIKNIVSGRLPRALLIQIQKTKVDGAVAISGIDKLLKSQELVFGIVAASPSLLILMYLLGGVNSYLKKGYFARSTGENKLIASRNLNNVERLLGSLDECDGDQLDYVNGMLLLEIISLRNAGMFLVPKNRRFEWLRDVNDLVNSKSTTKTRLNTVSRIYHVYGAFLE